MPRGRSSPPTPLPAGFKSWTDLWRQWEEFLASGQRTFKPSRAEIFAAKHNMPPWVLGTIPYIFRTAERKDAAGEYAKKIIQRIEKGELGVPKANNEIRAFVKQNPRFRDKKVQETALNETIDRVRDLAALTESVRNFSPDFTREELEQYHSNLSTHMRKLQQLKNRIAWALQERTSEGGVQS